jgi:hypothetical protein
MDRVAADLPGKFNLGFALLLAPFALAGALGAAVGLAGCARRSVSIRAKPSQPARANTRSG